VHIVTDARVASTDFENRLSEISEIQQCFSVAGEETYVAFVLTRSPKTLEKVLQRIKSTPGTVSTKASVILSSPISRHTLPQEDEIREYPAEVAR
jgi:Lrp/AsnC family leucine-responsive transcriptional regulator